MFKAEQELSNDWELMRQGMKDIPTPTEYLSKNLKAGVKIIFHMAFTLNAIIHLILY